MTTVAVDAFLIYAVLGFHFPTGRNSQYSVRVFLQHHGHCKVYLKKFKCNANYHKGAPKRDSPVQLKAIPTDWLEAPIDTEAAAPLRSAESTSSMVNVTSVEVLRRQGGQ